MCFNLILNNRLLFGFHEYYIFHLNFHLEDEFDLDQVEIEKEGELIIMRNLKYVHILNITFYSEPHLIRKI